MYFARNNQRAFHRMDLNLPIVITKEGRVYHAICLDLSSTGMGIEFTTTELKSGDQIDIQLDTNDDRFPPLNAEAKILRIGPGNNEKLTAAVHFLALK